MSQKGITSVSQFEQEKPVETMKEINAAIAYIRRAKYADGIVDVIPAKVMLTRLEVIKKKFKAGE